MLTLFLMLTIRGSDRKTSSEALANPTGPLTTAEKPLDDIPTRRSSTRVDAMTGAIACVLLVVVFAAPVRGQEWRTRCLSETKPDLVIHYCTQAIQSGELNEVGQAVAYNNRGIGYADQEDYERAIRDYNQAIRLDPTLASAYNNRAYVHWKKKDYSRALLDYDQAIRLDEKFALAYNGRGNVYAAKNNYDRAILDYNQAIRLDSNNAVAYHNRGIAYHNRGIAYRKKGDYDRAIQDYNEAIRLNPKDPLVYNDRGITYRNKGDYDRAIQNYNQAIRLNAGYANAYINRGNVYSDKKDYDRAIQNYTPPIRLEPNDDLAYYNRAHQHFYKGQFSAAAMDFAKSVELQHGDTDIDRVIWLYLAERRAGQTGSIGLERRASSLKLDKWRRAVVEFLLDRMTDGSLFRAAEDPNSQKRTEQMCEANYFTAQAKLMRGNIKDAVPQLRSAATDCSRNVTVLAAVLAELKRLRVK